MARHGGGWRLVRRPGAFRRLWLARVTSLLGDSVGLVALILLVAGETGDGVSVGLLLLAADGTATLLSPLLGVIADRTEQRRTMIACELGQALAIGTIAVLRPPLAVLLGLVAVQSVLAATVQAAARSAVAELVDDAELEGANAVLGAGTYGLEAAGPLLVALLLPVLDLRGVLALDALTFVLSPLLLARLPRLRPAVQAPGTTPGLSRQAAAGVRVVWRHRLLRTVALGFLAVVAFNGVDDVALVFLGQETLRAGDAMTSLLYAGSGLGLLVGFALLARRDAWGAPAAVAVAGLAWSSAGNLLTGLAPVLGAAFAMQVVRGGGLSLVDVGTTTLVQRSVRRELRGRAFANLYGGVGRPRPSPTPPAGRCSSCWPPVACSSPPAPAACSPARWSPWQSAVRDAVGDEPGQGIGLGWRAVVSSDDTCGSPCAAHGACLPAFRPTMTSAPSRMRRSSSSGGKASSIVRPPVTYPAATDWARER